MTPFNRLVGGTSSTMMSEFDALKRILAYIVESRLKATLEAEVQRMTVEANV